MATARDQRAKPLAHFPLANNFGESPARYPAYTDALLYSLTSRQVITLAAAGIYIYSYKELRARLETRASQWMVPPAPFNVQSLHTHENLLHFGTRVYCVCSDQLINNLHCCGRVI